MILDMIIIIIMIIIIMIIIIMMIQIQKPDSRFQMARILGGCAPALDYSQEAKKLWAKLGENLSL